MRMSDHDLAVWRNKHGEDIPVPPKPKKRDNEESRAQCAVIVWWHHMHRTFGVPETLLFAIPNGGWRSVVTASILKREGLRSGACDLFLSVPRGQLHGCYIEMKTAKGVVSDEQRNFMYAANDNGYAVNVCRKAEEAMAVITRYLNGGVS